MIPGKHAAAGNKPAMEKEQSSEGPSQLSLGLSVPVPTAAAAVQYSAPLLVCCNKRRNNFLPVKPNWEQVLGSCELFVFVCVNACM